MTYVYECQKCGHRLELEQSISDEHRPDCPYPHVVPKGETDVRKMERVIQPVGFSLKGGGWAKDGYGSKR